jgi:hypothetical protein
MTNAPSRRVVGYRDHPEGIEIVVIDGDFCFGSRETRDLIPWAYIEAALERKELEPA